MMTAKDVKSELTGDLEATDDEAESVKGGVAKVAKSTKQLKSLKGLKSEKMMFEAR